MAQQTQEHIKEFVSQFFSQKSNLSDVTKTQLCWVKYTQHWEKNKEKNKCSKEEFLNIVSQVTGKPINLQLYSKFLGSNITGASNVVVNSNNKVVTNATIDTNIVGITNIIVNSNNKIGTNEKLVTNVVPYYNTTNVIIDSNDKLIINNVGDNRNIDTIKEVVVTKDVETSDIAKVTKEDNSDKDSDASNHVNDNNVYIDISDNVKTRNSESSISNNNINNSLVTNNTNSSIDNKNISNSVTTNYIKDNRNIGDSVITNNINNIKDNKNTFTEKDIHVVSTFNTIIKLEFPISMRSFFDNMKLMSYGDCVILYESNSTIKKYKVKPLDKITQKLEKNNKNENIIAHIKSSIVRLDNMLCSVESTNSSDHDTMVDFCCTKLLSKVITYEQICHSIVIPNRQINFKQFVNWLTTKNIQFTKIHNEEYVKVDQLFQNCKCEIRNVTLESNRYYDNVSNPIYRLRGEKILQIDVYGNIEVSTIKELLFSYSSEFNTNITEYHVNPLSLQAEDIARLRSSNGYIFDNEYCRKAPPRVQPIVIEENQIDQELSKGKMILKYGDHYYTTKDANISNGENYIGMINQADLDPRDPNYKPIIRTYKTNHLYSVKYKELKTYLLRNYYVPNRLVQGYIDPKDIILPLHMKDLYKLKITNQIYNRDVIHTKKTRVLDAKKAHTGEVPDYIKSVLDTDAIIRFIYKGKDSGLLNWLGVDKEELKVYIRNNIIDDLKNIDVSTLEGLIDSGELDHRLFGKALENTVNKNIIVFGMDGVIPYRVSKYERVENITLFQYDTDDGIKYDYLSINNEETKYKLGEIVNKINTKDDQDVLKFINFVPSKRKVDYVHIHIKICQYIRKICEENDCNVIYNIIDESQCKDYVEKIYNRIIYFEGYRKVSPNYNSLYVWTHGEYNHVHKKVSLLYRFLPEFMEYDAVSGNVAMNSVINLNEYCSWNLNLEDCLYNTTDCYHIENDEELVCIKSTN